jgi:hypothetical protein
VKILSFQQTPIVSSAREKQCVERTSARGADLLAGIDVLPCSVRSWTLTTLREKLIKIGAKIVRHAKAVTFQMAEVAVPCELFAEVLDRLGRLRASPQGV